MKIGENKWKVTSLLRVYISLLFLLSDTTISIFYDKNFVNQCLKKENSGLSTGAKWAK